jgi:hypothetical protein
MKTHSKLMLYIVPIALASVSAECVAQPVSTFYPSPADPTTHFEATVNAKNIEILPSPPESNVVILGKLSVSGNPNASIHELMVAALGEAANKGADFVALDRLDAQANLFLGKMVPVGHGRSMFVAGPLKGSEVGRISSIPDSSLGSIRVVLGKYLK